MERIEGRTAFITGGASGIGLAIAEALIEEGARVVIADVDAWALDTQAARLAPHVLAVRLDVTDRAAWAAARDATEAAFGPVAILVNNAGIGPDRTALADMEPANFDRMIAIKLTGTFNGIHTFAKGMRERGEGHIVNTASMAGLTAMARLGAYTASKFAVVGMSEVLRAEMDEYGVGVSVLCPGMVRTNIGQPLDGGGDRAPTTIHPVMAAAMDPARVATRVVAAIRANDLYILTHGELRASVAKRTDRLLAAFDATPPSGAGS
jgi:NAD(P)-dependent dehydrogenase (short-subunit alcohol dehydrogenase family)